MQCAGGSRVFCFAIKFDFKLVGSLNPHIDIPSIYLKLFERNTKSPIFISFLGPSHRFLGGSDSDFFSPNFSFRKMPVNFVV